ncbi:MAG TPA: hypothetical protein VFM45_09990, partial [Anaeromyxobacteraceae bacterium]|nr:hypothetical protein [Anaeromyxobacteraceae bacterium]
DEAARKLALLASVHLATGQPRKAVTAADQALQASQQDYVLFAAGQVLADAGEAKRALAIADELDRQVAAESRSYAEMIRGALSLKKGAAAEAVGHYRASLKLVDSWLGHLGLARAYVEAGSFNEALEEAERLEKRRGEATDVFLDVVPTVRHMPLASYLAGRAREGLKDPKAAESYQAFLATKQGAEDPLAADAARRLAKLGK